MQTRLRVQQRGRQLLDGRSRDEIGHELHRPLVERSAGFSAVVAFDAPVARVRSVAIDARELERAAVHPRAVTVAINQEDRSVRYDLVEHGALWRSARESVHPPSGAFDPFRVGVLARVTGDRLLVSVFSKDLVKIAPASRQSPVEWMNVRVLEPRHDHPRLELD